ncbi:CoA-acylating methylmalonate-semialdehyde dehydrogenase [Candidatus Margulisiibacteriota bacterium]
MTITMTDKTVLKVISPQDGLTLAEIRTTTQKELNQIVLKAENAFRAWKNKTSRERAQVFYKYKQLLEDNISELSEIIHKENGKTIPEAKAEIEKAIEVTEFACSLPQIIADEHLEVSKGIECKISKEPIGVVASITPFNFPSMVPHWTMPIALTLGNTMIMKPSEKTPLSAVRIADLLAQAGLPENVFNVVQGEKEMVEAICSHEKIKAVSFVGSTAVAKIVYKLCSNNYKRVLCMGGAKNHLVVVPDADPDMTASNVAASFTGCAGQRCMAASVLVAVGKVDHIIEKLVEESRKIIPGKNMGAIITQEAKNRIEAYINEAEQQGAKILLDGRNSVVPGKEKGFYVGPTIIDNVTPEMKVAKEEVFGPVLAIIRTNTIDEAIILENASEYGNAAAIFTQSGGIASDFAKKASAGMIGVNIGVPVPREPFSFGGINDSRIGVGDITGKSSINFWTQPKKITAKWNPGPQVDWMS